MPFVDGFITVSERILKDYRDKYKVARYTLVHNCPPPRPSKRTTSLRQELGLQQDDILFIYQGGLTYGRGLEVLIKAFSQPTPGRHLIVMGYGVLADMVEQAADQSQYLHYKSAVPPEVLLEYTASADVGIALIEPICLSYEYCLPNKLFEYAMAGLPVIVSPLPEMKEKVERYSIGKVLPDHSAESLRKVVEEWSSDSYESFVDNLKEFSEKYNWDVESARMLALYRSIST
jgi:glycosyltransferase involved in cell wall biosynthesis